MHPFANHVKERATHAQVTRSGRLKNLAASAINAFGNHLIDDYLFFFFYQASAKRINATSTISIFKQEPLIGVPHDIARQKFIKERKAAMKRIRREEEKVVTIKAPVQALLPEDVHFAIIECLDNVWGLVCTSNYWRHAVHESMKLVGAVI